MSFYDLNDWVHLAFRMLHLVAGIMWIGNSFYFMWLDSSLTPPEPKREGVESELWMVHSGGFYRVERRRIEVGAFPKVLHWFKWEATFTWISGFCLLVWIYYLNSSLNLIEPGQAVFSPKGAVLASLGVLVGTWFLYDAIWRLPLAKTAPRALSAFTFGLVCVLAFLLCRIFPGKAAFIHLGAVFGTIMVTNVWVHILPSQQKMIDATREGRAPDYELGKNAKRRSTHNSYMTMPVLFVMLSNHFGGMFGAKHADWVLVLLVLLGGGIRHIMLKGVRAAAWVFPALVVVIGLLISLTSRETSASYSSRAAVPFSQIKDLVNRRCVACHAAHPSDPTFGPSPAGISFEDPARIAQLKDRILLRVVQTKTMPVGNKTGVTDEERETMGAWIAQGAKGE